MTYRVVLDTEAQEEFDEVFWYIHADSPGDAANWLREFDALLDSLASWPVRYGYARENDQVPQYELRQIIPHSHRVIYNDR